MDAVECNGADVRALFVRELMTASDRQGLRRSTTCCTIVARQQKVLHYQALGRTAGPRSLSTTWMEISAWEAGSGTSGEVSMCTRLHVLIGVSPTRGGWSLMHG
jgi:hypothetical protein